MTKVSVMNFENYKKFISEFEESRKSFERGFRSKLAESIGCQSGYISHVLNGDAHFSLEQAIKSTKLFNMIDIEKKYFLLLVEYARAGSKELSDFFQNELNILREDYLNIKTRVGESRTLTESEQITYYSSWHYLAIHVLTSLNHFNEVKTISQALSIPEKITTQVILFLLQSGILREEKGKLVTGVTQVHLNRESPLILQHHTNWRVAVMQSLANQNKTDVHYSTVSTLSKKDAEILRSKMVKLIEEYVETVKPSKEETMFGFNLDFYNLIKR